MLTINERKDVNIIWKYCVISIDDKVLLHHKIRKKNDYDRRNQASFGHFLSLWHWSIAMHNEWIDDNHHHMLDHTCLWRGNNAVYPLNA